MPQKGEGTGRATAPATPPPGIWEDFMRYSGILGGGVADLASQMAPTFPRPSAEMPGWYEQVDLYGRPTPNPLTKVEDMTRPPAGLGEYLASLGGTAGDIMGQRGTLVSGGGPLSKVMTEEGWPLRVYRGKEAVYPQENPRFWRTQGKQFPKMATYNENPSIAQNYAQAGPPDAPHLTFDAAQIADAQSKVQALRNQIATTRDPVKRQRMEARLLEQERIAGYAPNVGAHYLDITKPFDIQRDRIPIDTLREWLYEQGGDQLADPNAYKLLQAIREHEARGGRAQRLSAGDRKRGVVQPPDEDPASLSWFKVRDAVGPSRAAEILRDFMDYNGMTTVWGMGKGGRTLPGQPTGRTWGIWDPRREYPGWITTEALGDLERQRNVPLPREWQPTAEYLPERNISRAGPAAPAPEAQRESLKERLARIKRMQQGGAP